MLVYRDYYPFGWELPGRTYTLGAGYRYGFQGEYAERDEETGWSAFELRSYDGRVGRWMSIDPYEEFWSPYVAFGNTPHQTTDPTGGYTDDIIGVDANGNELWRIELPGEDIFISWLDIGTTVTAPKIVEEVSPDLIGLGAAAAMTAIKADVGIPDPSNAAWIKWIGEGLLYATAASYLYYNPVELPLVHSPPYTGHGNRRNNSNAHEVYAVVGIDKITQQPEVLKFGIGDLIKNPNRRNQSVKDMQRAFGTQYSGIHGFRVNTQSNRLRALVMEQTLVTGHLVTKGFVPKGNIRPLPKLDLWTK
ncbi:MAG: RHS repeat-associated core domain-containing protein [Cyanobacteria bacterium J06649_11]